MPAVMKAEWRSPPLETKWDRGRRILTLVKLAGGGGILLTSIISIAAAIFGSRTSDLVDITAALLGAVASFGFLAARFHVFSSHAAGDLQRDVTHRDLE